MKKLISMLLTTILLLNFVGCEEKRIDTDMKYYADGLITEKSYKEIEARFGLFPSSIYIDDDYTKIGWIFEGGVFGCACEDDPTQTFRFNKEGQEFHFYDSSLEIMRQEYATLYYGSLEHVDDGVYSVRGEFCPYYEELNKTINVVKNVDFYLVFDEEKMFIIFEEITEEELSGLNFDSYFIKVGAN